jgi:hypothetical protein
LDSEDVILAGSKCDGSVDKLNLKTGEERLADWDAADVWEAKAEIGKASQVMT